MPETASAEQIDPITEPARSKPKGFFTKENARHYSEMGKQALALYKEAKENPIQHPPDQPLTESDAFHCRTLARVRAMMARLQGLMEREDDPSAIDRLSAAFSKHEEVERRLSDRSLPAVRRVQDQGKPSRASSLLGD